MEINLYFDPVNLEGHDFSGQPDINRLGNIVSIHTASDGFPDLRNAKIALIGAVEDRGALRNTGCGKAPDSVRDYFYRLFSHWKNPNIVDLGNLKRGHSVEDSYFALKEALAYLIRENIIPVIIGGSQDITYANYLAYESIGRIINIASVDPQFDLGHDDDDLNSRSFLSRIILHQPNFLFNYTNIGYQSYFVDQEAINLMRNLYFDINRLGNVRSNMEEVEPMIRNADILSFDMASVRGSDSPGCFYAGPNGFTGEEACRIFRYAGMSDKLSSIGIYETNPSYDKNGFSAHLAAQMIWYFVDGFMNRKGDQPEKDAENYLRFTVSSDEIGEELVFLKSKKSERWWIEVQMKSKFMNKYKRHQFVPCSYLDYQAAMKHEIPDRWWKVQQKLL